jgi:hypothetical protein
MRAREAKRAIEVRMLNTVAKSGDVDQCMKSADSSSFGDAVVGFILRIRCRFAPHTLR